MHYNDREYDAQSWPHFAVWQSITHTKGNLPSYNLPATHTHAHKLFTSAPRLSMSSWLRGQNDGQHQLPVSPLMHMMDEIAARGTS